jgi:hypothetical protein
VGEFFTSFDAAWSAFLERREPLEWFFGDFAEDEGSVAEGWLVEAPAHVKEGAVELQDALAHLDWLTPVPDHFLHVWLAGPGTMGNAYERWADVRPFAAEFRRVNCFHSAVVVEAAARLPDLSRSRRWIERRFSRTSRSRSPASVTIPSRFVRCSKRGGTSTWAKRQWTS